MLRRRVVSFLLLSFLTLVAFSPVFAGTTSAAQGQRQSQKAAKKYAKQQQKAQKQQIKQQNKATRKWNKQHPHVTTT